VTLSGAAPLAAPASSEAAPPSAFAPVGPSAQVLPLWHMQVAPVHAQFPVHVSWDAAQLSEPHPLTDDVAMGAKKRMVPVSARVKNR
jgi:hypothetical protein